MSDIVIRASSLSQYPDCQRRSAARLFRWEIEDAGFRLRRTVRGIGAVIGTAVHFAAKLVNQDHAKHGILPPVDVATDAALGSLKAETGDLAIEFDGPLGATHNMRDAERQTISMSRAYHRVIAPTIHPIRVEERLEAEIEPGLILSGQSDVVAREPDSIHDLKTGARRAGSNAPQLGAYSLLARSHGLDIATASIDWIQRVPVTKPQPDPVTRAVAVAPAETAASNILRTMARDLKTFREGDPQRRIPPGDPWAFLANPSSMLCSRRWCPAFGTEFCREGDIHEGN